MMQNMKIGTRMTAGYVLIFIIFILSSVYSIFQMNAISNRMILFHDHPFTITKLIRDAESDIERMHKYFKDVRLAENNEEFNTAIEKINFYEQEFHTDIQNVKELFTGDKAKIDQLISEFDKWKPIRDEQIRLVKSGEKEKINRKENQIHIQKLEGQILDILKFEDSKAEQFVSDSQKNTQQTTNIMVFISIILLIIIVVLAVFTTGSITSPMNNIIKVAERITDNDLTMDLPAAESKDETGILIQSFKKMTLNLREQIQQIIEGVNSLASSASEISSSVSQFTASASETLTSVNETTITVEEAVQAATMTTQKAQKVSEIAQQSFEISEKGKKATNDNIAGINRIQEQMNFIAESIMKLSEQSQAIGEIIATVDDLSDQSNLLAVNAAIEATRAGEYGKGFSVVAQEIRNMAEQSKKSTNRIRTILNDVQKATSNAVMATEQGAKAVEAGIKQSAQAGESIGVMAQTISESANAAIQIAASNKQQMVGMNQIAIAMENIKQASNQNVESSKMLEASAHNLANLGQKLKNMVDSYKL